MDIDCWTEAPLFLWCLDVCESKRVDSMMDFVRCYQRRVCDGSGDGGCQLLTARRGFRWSFGEDDGRRGIPS